MERPSPQPVLFPVPFLIIATVAFAVIVPFFFLGLPSGHDFEFHMNSWMEVVQQWKHGTLLPRWAPLAHYGYGEARFIFYPPLSWILGALLGTVLPWWTVPGAYIWLSLTLSGCSMFLLARQWLGRRDAIFAAALYAANPYYLVTVYWRSAFAELLAGALLPMLFLLLLREKEDGPKIILPLSLLVGAAWLTNVPAAVMVNYSLALLAVMFAITRRSARVLLVSGAAVAVGTALAAFYLVPVVHEQSWVNLEQVLSPGLKPTENFLFTRILDPEHNAFNLLVSMMTTAEMLALAGAVALWARRKKDRTSSWPLLAWAGAAVLLMSPVTAIFWDYLPKLRFVQLPWRWLLCLNVAFALLVSMAWRRWFSRIALCIMLLAVLAAGWRRVQPPWWDTAEDIVDMHEAQIDSLQDNLQDGPGYEGTDEYVPIAADPYEIKQAAPRVVFEGDGKAQVQVPRWTALQREVRVNAETPGALVLRLFNYPAWHVEVNGRVVQAETREVTGQMMVPVEAGASDVKITFVHTGDQAVGAGISVVAALCIAAFVAARRKRH